MESISTPATATAATASSHCSVAISHATPGADINLSRDMAFDTVYGVPILVLSTELVEYPQVRCSDDALAEGVAPWTQNEPGVALGISLT